jgi:class 3 adenylate cyclase
VDADLFGRRYEVLRSVSSTDGSEVCKARDREHDSIVALKFFAIDDPSRRQDMLAESEVLLRLPPHPGLPIVRYDFFVPGGYVIVMDWVDGADLARVLRERGNPGLRPPAVVDYVSQAARALDHLARGEPPVVHGDVKPSNLVLTPRGEIVLVDFGLPGLSGPARRAGTRGYVAPEVAPGSAPTPAADVYGLAATTVTLLTGHPPDGRRPLFEGVDPEDVRPFTLALRRGLTTDPAHRPATAGELAEALRAARKALWSGVVTFVVIGLADSSRLWDERPDLMPSVCARLDGIVTDTVDAAGGRVLKSITAGDVTWSVFREATPALQAARLMHRRVADERWAGEAPVSLCIGIHSGETDVQDGEYRGVTVNTAVRLSALSPGTGTAVSSATAGLLRSDVLDGCDLVDTGMLHKQSHNLPIHLTRFIARRIELDQLAARIRANRLCTITGPGGVGKTSSAGRRADPSVVSARLLGRRPCCCGHERARGRHSGHRGGCPGRRFGDIRGTQSWRGAGRGRTAVGLPER